MLLKFQRQTNTSSPQKIVEVTLGGMAFGINIAKIVEIVPFRGVTQVPESNEFLLGIINVRGSVIPVGDIRLKMKLPVSSPTIKSGIVITDSPGFYAGFVVDYVKNKLRDVTENWKIENVNSPYFTEKIVFDQQELMLLDLEKIFNEEEKQLLEKVAKNF